MLCKSDKPSIIIIIIINLCCQMAGLVQWCCETPAPAPATDLKTLKPNAQSLKPTSLKNPLHKKLQTS